MKLGSQLIYACTDDDQATWLLKVRDYLLKEKLISEHEALSMHSFRPWYMSDYRLEVVAGKYALKQFLDGLYSLPSINLNRPEYYINVGMKVGEDAVVETCNPNSIIFHHEWWEKYSKELVNSPDIRMDFKDIIHFCGVDYRYFVDGNRTARPYHYKFIRSL